MQEEMHVKEESGCASDRERQCPSVVFSLPEPAFIFPFENTPGSLVSVTYRVANGVIFFKEVGKNYFLNFTHWAHKESTARLTVIAFL